MKPAEGVPDSNDEYVNPEKFGGKTLQIYGCSSITYDDIENMEGEGTFIWMMRAAIISNLPIFLNCLITTIVQVRDHVTIISFSLDL
jgi:hypothetical protein